LQTISHHIINENGHWLWMFLVRHGSAAIVIVHTMLQSLGLQSLRSIPHGRIFIGFNEHLCYADTVNWEMITGRTGAARQKMNGQECGMSQVTHLYIVYTDGGLAVTV